MFLTNLAYLDAGSGSLIVQVLAGGAAAIAVAGRFYWRRLLSFLRIRRADEPEVAKSDAPA